MMQIESSDAWEKTRTMAEYCNYTLGSDLSKAGPFSITRHPYSGGNFTYRNLEDERLKEISVDVIFSSPETRYLSPHEYSLRSLIWSSNERNFSHLTVSSPDIGKQTLHKGGITEGDKLAKQDIYPSVQYLWLFGSSSEKGGQLSSVRVDLAEDTHAVYYLNVLPFCAKKGDPYLLRKLPDGIEGLEEAIRRPIPRRIDYEDYAKEILERSMLKQLHQACLDLPKPDLIQFFSLRPQK